MKRKEPVLVSTDFRGESITPEFLHHLYIGLLLALEEQRHLNTRQLYQAVALLEKEAI